MKDGSDLSDLFIKMFWNCFGHRNKYGFTWKMSITYPTLSNIIKCYSEDTWTSSTSSTINQTYLTFYWEHVDIFREIEMTHLTFIIDIVLSFTIWSVEPLLWSWRSPHIIRNWRYSVESPVICQSYILHISSPTYRLNHSLRIERYVHAVVGTYTVTQALHDLLNSWSLASYSVPPPPHSISYPSGMLRSSGSHSSTKMYIYFAI